jgi:hypothetical protein
MLGLARTDANQRKGPAHLGLEALQCKDVRGGQHEAIDAGQHRAPEIIRRRRAQLGPGLADRRHGVGYGLHAAG